MPMLDIGRVGGTEWAIHWMAMILAAFVASDSPPSIPRRVSSLSSSFILSVLILVPPSHLSSPALLPCLFPLSFGISPPQDNARALPHSRSPSPPSSSTPSCLALVLSSLLVHFVVPPTLRFHLISHLRAYSTLF